MAPSILIVDDDDSVRMLLALILRRAGYQVHHAASAAETHKLIQSTVPDVFLIDIMMPNISGFELCLDLKANPRTAASPIFLLSARSDRRSIEAASDCGAERYLTKPVPAEELVAHVQHALAQRAAN